MLENETFDHYLRLLENRGSSPSSVRAARSDMAHFRLWWETRYGRTLDVAQLSDRDLRSWREYRQKEEGAAPATINRGLSTLRRFSAWAVEQNLITSNPAAGIKDVQVAPNPPRSLPDQAVDALLRAARVAEDDRALRLRDEALLALLVYGGLRVQEACDVQLRDLDLPGKALVVRSGKGSKAGRIFLHAEAARMLHTYIKEVRCPPNGQMPKVGSPEEREPLLVGKAMKEPGQPLRPGLQARMVGHKIKSLGKLAASQLREAARKERADNGRAEELEELARQLEDISPHMLRHSLARRMLDKGAQLPEVQRMLRHSRLSTTGVYLTSREEQLRAAVERAGL